MKEFGIRMATPDDVAIIKACIEALADFEKLSHEVIVTEKQLLESLFGRHEANCLLAFEGEQSVGFAIYFYNYSTFMGKKGLYLEDLFVHPSYRGLGYGKKLLLAVANLALKEDCGRMEWSVLDWNTVAIDFYKNMGAKPMDGWTGFRLTRKSLEALFANPS